MSSSSSSSSSSAAADHAAFLRRTMVKSAPTKVDIGVVVKPVNRETGSCFESTVYKGGVRPGAHPDLPSHVDGEEDAFSIHVTTHRPHPQLFQAKGTGLGGTSNPAKAASLAAAHQAAHALAGPPKANAKTVRPNPPNSDFRK